jgi:arylsulfatase A-like enzyme
LFQQLVHVPLIISYPRKLQAGRVERPVANVNIYSTLCDLAGITPPDTPLSRDTLTVPLASLAQNVFTESISVDRLGWDKIQKWYPDAFSENPREQMFKAVIQDDWKLMVATDQYKTALPDQTELFNLADDPEELTNVADAHPDKVAALGELIEGWKSSVPPYDPDKREEGEGPKVDSEAMKKQLEMLGYLSEEDDEEEVEVEAPAEAGDTDAPTLE